MAYTSWRGVVGVIKPTYRPGSLEEFIRLLPEGVGVIPLFLDARRGTVEEFSEVIGRYEAKVEELAGIGGVDLIHPEGAPPFMTQGFEGEARLVKGWEEKFEVPIVTAGQTQVEAMRALGVRRIVAVTYFQNEVNGITKRYFEDAGFDVLAVEGIAVPFEDVGRVSHLEVYAHAKRAFLAHDRTEAIYMLGSGWRSLDAIDLLEQDLGVPVVHPVPARVWAVQKRLRIHEPVDGYGRLLADLP